MVNQDQLKGLQQRILKIGEYLKIDEKRMQLKEEELKTQDPDFDELSLSNLTLVLLSLRSFQFRIYFFLEQFPLG